ncbi:MAG: hypothetical protein V2J62_06460 [candidate division KSB1 bacterium]|jgi:hypothetical protein|nr:hypothetical protein [candidate division KSB1 bacterium]
MDVVNFITVEDGRDLILSFSFDDGTEFGIDGFTIQRTPDLEYVLQPHEKGASIDWTDDDEIILVTNVELSADVIRIYSRPRNYAFDISGLDEDDRKRIMKILKKMNFDDKFIFEIQ